jgi:hypothetical protein
VVTAVVIFITAAEGTLFCEMGPQALAVCFCRLILLVGFSEALAVSAHAFGWGHRFVAEAWPTSAYFRNGDFRNGIYFRNDIFVTGFVTSVFLTLAGGLSAMVFAAANLAFRIRRKSSYLLISVASCPCS